MRLTYFDTVRMVLIDPLHCCFLGAAKNLWKRLVKNKHITKEHLKAMTKFLEKTTVPNSMSRLPNKLLVRTAGKGFSKLTGDEWKSWTLVYSVAAMKHAQVSKPIINMWKPFVDACKQLTGPYVDTTHIHDARKSFGTFHLLFQQYTKDSIEGAWCTQNTHQLLHLCDMVEDYGPFAAFWGFGCERINGVLTNIPHNNRDITIQLMRFMLNIQQMHQAEQSLPAGMQQFTGGNRDTINVVVNSSPTHAEDTRIFQDLDNPNGSERIPGQPVRLTGPPKLYDLKTERLRLHLEEDEEEPVTIYSTLLEFLSEYYPAADWTMTVPHIVEQFDGYHIGGQLIQTRARNVAKSWIYVSSAEKKEEHPEYDNAAQIVAFYLIPVELTNKVDGKIKTVEHTFAYVHYFTREDPDDRDISYIKFCDYYQPIVSVHNWLPLPHILGQLAIHETSRPEPPRNNETAAQMALRERVNLTRNPLRVGMRVPLTLSY
jgi:hypothetical protein